VTLRLRATVKSPQARLVQSSHRTGSSRRDKSSTFEAAAVFFDGKRRRAHIYERDALRAGKRYAGPAVIAEYSATTVVPPGTSFRIDRAANLQIDLD
jgi:N-methylhydantoinase A